TPVGGISRVVTKRKTSYGSSIVGDVRGMSTAGLTSTGTVFTAPFAVFHHIGNTSVALNNALQLLDEVDKNNAFTLAPTEALGIIAATTMSAGTVLTGMVEWDERNP